MSTTGAILSGSYSGASSIPTAAGFKYGTTSGSLTQTAATSPEVSGTEGSLSATLSNLEAGTKYYYKAFVTVNGTGNYSSTSNTFYGEEYSFITTQLPVSTAIVTTSAATDITYSSATLNGSYSGATGTISSKGFEYKPEDGVSTWQTVAGIGSDSFSASISDLEPSTTYVFQAYVMEQNQRTGQDDKKLGSTQTFTTSAAPQPQPSSLPGHLGCYEIPAVTNVAYSGTGAEVLGDTNWYRYNTGNDNQKIVTHTFKNDQVSPNRVMRSYTLLQDYDKKCALWVACAMNGDDYPSKVSRTDNWAYDPALDEDWQPNLTKSYPDKNGQSYDRGHQLASSYRRTTTYQAQMTCYFTNMTPQLAALNQGVWQSTIESNICEAGLATKGRDTLYVISGPLFQSGYGTVEDKDGVSCAKPTHYYQCFMRVSFNNSGVPQSAIGAAYLVEHVASPTIQYVTIDYVESLAGFDFFANVPASIQNNAEETATPISNFKSTSNIASVGDNNWGSL